MIDRLLEILANEEGFRAFVYDDANGEPIVPGYTVVGHPTMWIGLCVEKGRVPKLPEALPRDVLEFVAVSKWGELQSRAPWLARLHEDVQLALALMSYQLGADGMFGFKNMLAALERGDRATAADEAIRSTWARQTPARARRVAALIRGHG